MLENSHLSVRKTKAWGGYCLGLAARDGPSELVMIKLRLRHEKASAGRVGGVFPAGTAVKMPLADGLRTCLFLNTKNKTTVIRGPGIISEDNKELTYGLHGN